MRIISESAWQQRYQALAGTGRYEEIPEHVYSDQLLRECFHPPFDIFVNLVDGRALIRCPDYWLDEANQRTGSAAESATPGQWLILSEDPELGLRADYIGDADVDRLARESGRVLEGPVN